MLDIQRAYAHASDLIDSAAIVADLKALAETHAGRERELRTAVARRLEDGADAGARPAPKNCCSRTATAGAAPSGCAATQDEIIRILFEFADQARSIRRRSTRRPNAWR